ncbi:amidohydrolase [Terriglobus roseus DSM 18391]|uniref:Amidohydrolase n=1 Tax=Terriglobus roseus (strain DSM 18391 / NRRL B-41598 / KBS 63) TaxID=926566 RepID=I3ZDA8_TERRK|nr:amidohydrolase [Terriglobus roseus]AFL87226.1 amidohydrolase [Terriglobus roseus DSM 18391]
MRLPSLVLLATLALPAMAQIPPDTLRREVDAQMPALEKTYLALHAAPELSRQEEKTSAFVAGELKRLGYDVTDHVGKYADGASAFGVVGLLKNGAGPTVLIRTDMDALPVTEETGLVYASKVRGKTPQGDDVGVMHACGHDVHMSAFLGVAAELAQHKKDWHGTVMMVGQPAEEVIQGAKAMMDDGLYTRFPRPNYVVGMHDFGNIPAGSVGISSGPMMASADSVTIVFHGAGAHGSQPQNSKDPIYMGAEFINLVQGVVSRQISPQSPGVITVGTFHAGTKNNIIPPEATLGLTIRSYDEATRQKLLDGIRNAANGVAVAYGLPADKMPTITHPEATEPTVNDAALTERVRKAAAAALGADKVLTQAAVMGSEDVGYLTDGYKIPMTFFRLGAGEPVSLASAAKAGKTLPDIHSPLFAPDYKPAIETGVVAMTAVAVSLLQ